MSHEELIRLNRKLSNADAERESMYSLNETVGTINQELKAEITELRAINADLLAACKALRLAALNMRGEVVVTGELTAATLQPMFEADDLAQAAISKAEGVK